jgi:hypothetical protein
LRNFRITRLGFWSCFQFSDLETKIKEKENKREVITPRVNARVLGAQQYELGSK